MGQWSSLGNPVLPHQPQHPRPGGFGPQAAPQNVLLPATGSGTASLVQKDVQSRLRIWLSLPVLGRVVGTVLKVRVGAGGAWETAKSTVGQEGPATVC